MSEKLPVRTSPFVGTGLEFIHDELKGLGQELMAASTDLEAVEQQKKDAVAEAEAPFSGPILEARTKLNELKKATGLEVIAEKIQQSNLDPLSLTALDIILRSNGVPLKTFAEGIQELSGPSQNRHSPSHGATRTKRNLEIFSGFRSLTKDLQDTAIAEDVETIPVGLFTVEWQEETDIQAEWEGRDPSTGIYNKNVTVTLGKATLDDIFVVDQDIAPEGSLLPILQPKSIMLGLSKAIKLRSYSSWGEERADVEEVTDQKIELLTVPSDKDIQFNRTMAIDWRQSAKAKYPMLESVAPSNQAVFNKVHFIAWNNNVFSVLSKLAVDQNVAGITRSKLNEVASKAAEL